MPKIVHLFPDTNAFVQCRPLDQLDWNVWAEFDEVRLIVTRPVQNEIDKHKNKGADRLAKRARLASSLFREIINSSDDTKVVRENGPTVKLYLRPDLKPHDALSNRLDYSEPDDCLVGIAYGFAQQEGVETRVLTHDTGPLASAKMVGLPAVEIPDDWLLPPETTATEKKINVLEKEIAKLRLIEPAFHIECQDAEGRGLRVFEAELTRYAELSDDQRAVLLKQLQEGLPIVTDFGPREPPPRKMPQPPASMPFAAAAWQLTQAFANTFEEFVPASEQEITKYQADYPKWLTDCDKMLRGLNELLESRQPAPTLHFWASNRGTRPGRDVLVTIQRKGDFLICPPPEQSDDADGEESGPLELPRPPTAPRGRWQRETYGFLGDGLPDATAAYSRSISDAILAGLPRHRERDPNAFYWKPRKPVAPSASFSLECQQWRHAIDPEGFSAQIYAAATVGTLKGAVECCIHAENLSDPTIKRVPVRITIKQADTYEIAERLVRARLVTRPW